LSFIVLLASLLAGCTDSGSSEPPATTLDLFEQPVADSPDPAERAGASADILECDHGISQGGWSMDFGGPAGAPNPEDALRQFVEDGLFGLPGRGYLAAGQDDGRRLYTYSVEGDVKVAVIVADAASVGLDAEGWSVETFATCDPAEYDPSVDETLSSDIWLDAEGNRVPTSILTSFRGPEHCGWESVTYLSFAERHYLADPEDALRGTGMEVPYLADAELPADAVDTGYHLEGRHLWLSLDESVAYIVDEDGVEAWPSPTRFVGCA
jgi:hypothetical protein